MLRTCFLGIATIAAALTIESATAAVEAPGTPSSTSEPGNAHQGLMSQTMFMETNTFCVITSVKGKSFAAR